MTTHLCYSPEFNNHTASGHPENASRLTTLIHTLEENPLNDVVIKIDPKPLPEQLLKEIHSAEMIEQIKRISKTQDTWLDLDTYVCKNDYHTALLSAGAVHTLCQNVMNEKATNGFALTRPPGHHATATRSMGFCLFNNAALAAHALTKQEKKILIIDPDVHHGNGVQSIFYPRNDVLYQSIHLSPHFPGTGNVEELGIDRGTGYTNNAPLTYGNGSSAANAILKQIFLPIAEQFNPDFIIMCTGYDSHHADPLGGLKYTTQFYAEVLKQYQTIQPKIVLTLEGGYNLTWISASFIMQLGQLCGHPQNIHDTTSEINTAQPIIDILKKELGEYWDL